jgi:hypothetical protein
VVILNDNTERGGEGLNMQKILLKAGTLPLFLNINSG